MDDITNYIPQRAPIVMVSRIVESGSDYTKTSFDILQDNIFVTNSKIQEPGLIENIAQTAAAGVGYQCVKNNTKVPVGFIGGVNNIQIHRLPNVGETITTTVTVLQEVFGVTLIKGQIDIDQESIATCEMKIVIQNEQ